LDEEFPESGRVLVVGMLREKEPHEMLEAMGATDAELVICCAPPRPRAVSAETVASAARDLGLSDERIVVAPDVERAVQLAVKAAGAEGQVIVTGSLYT